MIPQYYYEKTLSIENRRIVATLPSHTTQYQGICVTGLGWRILDMRDGHVYNCEEYKEVTGSYPPVNPHQKPPFPYYADNLYREFLTVRNSYIKYQRRKSKNTHATGFKPKNNPLRGRRGR